MQVRDCEAVLPTSQSRTKAHYESLLFGIFCESDSEVREELVVTVQEEVMEWGPGEGMGSVWGGVGRE